MNLREIFKRKPAIRPESPKDVKSVVVAVEFPEWIDTLKREYANATIKVKRTQKLQGGIPAYVGDPIEVSNIDAATFDRLLYDMYGGGRFTAEYWQGSHRIMMKNSKPQTAVTHTIYVEGEPKPLPSKRLALQSAAQPKTLVGLLLKQFDTPEGIAAVTGFTTVAMEAVKGFMSGKNQSGGIKDTVETIGAIFKMLPNPPDEIDVLERYQKLSTMFAASARPPVNIGAASNTFWESITKVASQVAGTLIANAQSNGGEKLGVLQSPVSQGQSPEAAAGTMPGSPAAAPTPQQQFVNAKIASVQAAMAAKMEPVSIADEVWSLLAFLIDNGMVQDTFVQSLYGDPNRAFDQIIRTYAPESPSYPKLPELKRIVVEYIMEDAQLQQQNQTFADQIAQEPQVEAGEAADGHRMRVVDFPPREPDTSQEGSGESASETVRTDPVVIGDAEGQSDTVLPEPAQVTGED